MKPKLSAPGLMINGKYYRVMDFPRERVEQEGPGCLMKAVAYRIKTQLTDGLFPYRGIVEKDHPLTPRNSEVGIYFRKRSNGTYVMIIRRPMNKKEKAAYAEDSEMDVAVAFMNRTMSVDQLTNISASVGMDGNAFRPPIRAEDDMLNKVMKMCIRLKNAPFEPYGKVLEGSVGNSKSSEGTNIRNNTRRMLYVNNALSGAKYALCADVWQLDTAIIVKDSPDTVYPMFENGEMLVLYPNGYKFKIDPNKLVDAEEMIEAAINEAKSGEEEESVNNTDTNNEGV